MHSSTQEILTGKWHESKGKVRQQWGKLTEDDVTQVSGKMKELKGVLQQRYGYAKAKAEAGIKQVTGGARPSPLKRPTARNLL